MLRDLFTHAMESGVAGRLQGLQSISWRKVVLLLGTSFTLATICSITTGYFLLKSKDLAKATAARSGAAPGDSSGITIPGVTLNQAAVESIFKRNIFNSEGALGDAQKSTEEKGKTDTLVKSDLPLSLIGTIYGGTPFNGIAVIETTAKEKKINTFQVGDLLLKEATLVEVYPEKAILLRNNGQREYLLIKQEEAKLGRRRQKGGKAVVNSSLASSTSGGGYATTPPPDNFREDGFDRKGNEIQMNESYRDRMLSVDFAKVLQDAKATPNVVDNQLKGFVLTKIRKDSIYEKSGFMDGDVVEEINGVSLTDTAQTIKFLNTLRGEKEIEVRFRRGGQVSTKVLNVR